MEETDRLESESGIRNVRRLISVEPLLGPINALPLEGIDWVIVGGESGPVARPMNEEWVLSIESQCHDANVSFFSNNGAASIRNGRAASLTVERGM